MSLRVPLDEIDMSILRVLEEHGTKISTREVSEHLQKISEENIPERTVRYRISKLKEKGVLCKAKVQTHERKLGLAEYILVATSNPATEATFKKI
ncbi:MAG: winged-helix domain-containing protein, partial [Candidatus Thorarchaeota archaeon]